MSNNMIDETSTDNSSIDPVQTSRATGVQPHHDNNINDNALLTKAKTWRETLFNGIYKDQTHLDETEMISISKASDNNPKRQQYILWLLIIAGQVLSCLNVGTGVFNQLLAVGPYPVDIPTSQSFALYCMLACFTPYLIYKSIVNRNKPMTKNQQRSWHNLWGTTNVAWYMYAPLALADVEGNYCLTLAYQYTNITSAQLLDCMTIPLVLVFSWLLFKRKFNQRHIIGGFITLIGLGLMVISDLYATGMVDTSNSYATNKLWGDGLVLLGTICYATSNLGQEYIVKEYNMIEFWSMIGLWGTIISGIQLTYLDGQSGALSAVAWNNSTVVGYLCAFDICLFIFYIITPNLLRYSSALFFNLGMLTADFWSVIFAIYLFGQSLNFIFYIAFFVEIVGLVIYNLGAVDMTYKEMYYSIIGNKKHVDNILQNNNNTIDHSIDIIKPINDYNMDNNIIYNKDNNNNNNDNILINEKNIEDHIIVEDNTLQQKDELSV